MTKVTNPPAAPIHAFRFQVEFKEQLLGANKEGNDVVICGGAFSEVTGLEATVDVKTINEGGRNWGAAQRMGQVSFATVILKRGITQSKDLSVWFDLLGKGAYAHRMNAKITLYDHAGSGLLAWKLVRAMPTKLKSADLNAKATEVAVEELHLVHEGLEAETPGKRLGASPAKGAS